MFIRLKIISLTARASVLTSGERGFSDSSRAVVVVGVELPLIVRAINWVRIEGQVLITNIKVRVCRAVGGVHVISCVVGSSSFQCSDWTDKLRPVEPSDHRWSALCLFFSVEIKWENTFRLIFHESVKVISWNRPADFC